MANTRESGDSSTPQSATPSGSCAVSGRDQRSQGIIQLSVEARNGVQHVKEALQVGSAKLRMVRNAGERDAVILNTSGGLTSGDTFDVTVSLSTAPLTVTTQACERVYRCIDGDARVTQTLHVHTAGVLRFVPQPTILYNRARLTRRTEISVATGATLTVCEGLVLGREAAGERLTKVSLLDRITLRRDGTLLFADVFRLSPGALQGSAAGLAGKRGAGAILHVCDAPDAASKALRCALAGPRVVAGASVVRGIVFARVLATSHQDLQDALARGVTAVTRRAMPRAWSL